MADLATAPYLLTLFFYLFLFYIQKKCWNYVFLCKIIKPMHKLTKQNLSTCILMHVHWELKGIVAKKKKKQYTCTLC